MVLARPAGYALHGEPRLAMTGPIRVRLAMNKRSKVPARKAGFTEGSGHGAFKHVAPPARFDDVLKLYGHTRKSLEALKLKLVKLDRRLASEFHAPAR